MAVIEDKLELLLLLLLLLVAVVLVEAGAEVKNTENDITAEEDGIDRIGDEDEVSSEDGEGDEEEEEEEEEEDEDVADKSDAAEGGDDEEDDATQLTSRSSTNNMIDSRTPCVAQHPGATIVVAATLRTDAVGTTLPSTH